MTEPEWLGCDDPEHLLRWLPWINHKDLKHFAFMRFDPYRWFESRGANKISKRKWRLYNVACCRRVWGVFTDERCKLAIHTAERFADGVAGKEELQHAFYLACSAWEELEKQTDEDEPDLVADVQTMIAFAAHRVAGIGCVSVWGSLLRATWVTPENDDGDAAFRQHVEHEKRAYSCIFKDIFGNPFRPLAVDPAWLTPTVVGLAQGIYDDRAFDRMPVLADALEDANCTDAQILEHCRGPGPHARGCWVIDALLGKT